MKIPHDEGNDPVWGLLLKAKKVVINPFFSRNVLRTLRMQESAENRRWGWWNVLWGGSARSTMGLLSACAVAAFVGSFFTHEWPSVQVNEPLMAVLEQVPSSGAPSQMAGAVAAVTGPTEPNLPMDGDAYLEAISAELEWLGGAGSTISNEHPEADLEDEEVSRLLF